MNCMNCKKTCTKDNTNVFLNELSMISKILWLCQYSFSPSFYEVECSTDLSEANDINVMSLTNDT